jgi:hydrogenase maturation protein HypF
MSIQREEASVIELRVRGRVQGVGFRPTVWRVARELGLAGEVLNDGEGVIVRFGGGSASAAALLEGVRRELPPLACIEQIESRRYDGQLPPHFRIAESTTGGAHTQVTPDAVICAACATEIGDPSRRRYRYPFTNCTHCGPRLSIIRAIPYDRDATTMGPFALCDACRLEYEDPADRRFHAEPIACPGCGPSIELVAFRYSMIPRDNAADDIERAARLLREGAILAIKGLGGYHLACDAANADAVARLRTSKRRNTKPFALMARDFAVIRRYCTLDAEEERELAGFRAPIVLLRATGEFALPLAIAPGLDTLGFMLPTTPLHALLLRDMDAPLVMTSGNLSEEPPVIDDDEARRRLSGIADYALTHDREIANRIDDSVVRLMDGAVRVLRRARGFAPSPVRLPAGFEAAPEILAMGGELKASFCLVKDGQAILSQHQGDLEEAATFDDFRKNLGLYIRLFEHKPAAVVVDRHPEYLSTKLGREKARASGLRLVEAQHHHAHVAACFAENGRALDAPAALGIALDGLGFGDDGTIWGGEFLLADYYGYERLARLKPIAMPGGAQAVREPWRNLYAHVVAAIGWDAFTARHGGLDIATLLRGKPLRLLDRMIAKGVNAPLASSCGRLFDAVAAAIGVCPDRQTYEGEAAAGLEALAAGDDQTTDGYDFAIVAADRGPIGVDPSPMWRALLRDLEQGVSASAIALRFHRGLSRALIETALRLAGPDGSLRRFDTVAMTGGCFHNRLLLEGVGGGLREAGFRVLTHAEIPAGDGGLALGQAAIGAACVIADAQQSKG